ncbi:hypothetical protein [Porphyrobacter sp. TH134]|uniref:hypothetical protein n=1 Tax=Porphyrobacter sp. TH134 TaxID=2067450 RepID=UPI00117D8147|nr:hypothetical protein [Porphyrobacter sp. TH134]
MTDLLPQSVSKQEASAREVSQQSHGLLKVPDEFARAKRNVLFWAVVTFLLSMGEVGPSKSIEVTGFIRNFHFQQSFLGSGPIKLLARDVIG